MAWSPADAVGTLHRARGLHALVMVGDDGRATVAWRRDTEAGRVFEGWGAWGE